MRDQLEEVVREAPDPLAARNRAREYLQARILQSMQRAGAMIPLAFHGGTALRFLYGLPRHSEDLDFALERDQPGFELRRLAEKIRVDLRAEGYSVDLKVSDRRVVNSAFVRFAGLLFRLGLAFREQEILAIKLEVDTNPPAGAVLETTLLRRFVTLHLQHHDRASLLAGKLHAVLVRPYTKGRDLFDLIWYLSDRRWPAPNLRMLSSALEQSNWAGPGLAPDTWRRVVRDVVAAAEWNRVVRDVQPFIEQTPDLALMTRENLLKLLARE